MGVEEHPAEIQYRLRGEWTDDFRTRRDTGHFRGSVRQFAAGGSVTVDLRVRVQQPGVLDEGGSFAFAFASAAFKGDSGACHSRTSPYDFHIITRSEAIMRREGGQGDARSAISVMGAVCAPAAVLLAGGVFFERRRKSGVRH
jgi:uncharacterized Zn-binding protein involved in type VI secretion